MKTVQPFALALMTVEKEVSFDMGIGIFYEMNNYQRRISWVVYR